jgi:hypothetical protein
VHVVKLQRHKQYSRESSRRCANEHPKKFLGVEGVYHS